MPMIRITMEKMTHHPEEIKQEANNLPKLKDGNGVQTAKGGRRRLFVIAALAVLIAAAGTIAVLEYMHLKSQAKGMVDSASTSRQAVNSSPPTESASFGNIKAAYVTFPLSKAQAQTDPVYGPGQNIVTAGGHYLLLDPTGYTYDAKSSEGGKLIYDGKTVYNGPYLFRFALSDNGQHYLYVLDTDPKHIAGSQDIYIDGKKVQSVPDTKGVYYAHLSNNGKDYAFATGTSSGYLSTTELDKDGSTVFTVKNGIEVLTFSSDLSKYLLATPSTSSGDKYDLIANGQTVARNIGFMGAAEPSIALSPNGMHYIYTDDKAVFTNSDATQAVKSVAAMSVSDNGSFSVVDPLSNVVHVNSRSYTLPDGFASACSPACGGSFPVFAISSDGQHYVYGAQYPSLWSLDGSTIVPVGGIENVEFIGNTLYLYRWTNPYAGWRTYTSSNSEFSVKYPPTWQLSTNPEGQTVPVLTSPSGTKLYVYSDNGGKGGWCTPNPSDVPFQKGNTCSTLEYLASEKLPIDNLYYMDDLPNTDPVKFAPKQAPVYLVATHFADQGGVSSYGISVAETTTVKDTFVLNTPYMGSNPSYTWLTAYDSTGKSHPYIYIYANGDSPSFLTSNDATTIKNIIRSLTLNM